MFAQGEDIDETDSLSRLETSRSSRTSESESDKGERPQSRDGQKYPQVNRQLYHHHLPHTRHTFTLLLYFNSYFASLNEDMKFLLRVKDMSMQ